MPENKNNKSILQSAILPLGVAAATYGFLRFPKYSKGVLGELQRGSKGKLLIADHDVFENAERSLVYGGKDRYSTIRKILRSGDIVPTTSKELSKEKAKGVVYFTGSADRKDLKLPNVPEKNIPYALNSPNNPEHLKWNDKYYEYTSSVSHLPKDSYPEVRVFGHKSYSGKNVKSQVEQISQKHKKELNTDFIAIKPRYGRASGEGLDPHETIYRIGDYRFGSLPIKRENKYLTKNPKDYIVQKYVSSPRYSRSDEKYLGPTREFRVDIVGDKVLHTRPRDWPNVADDLATPGKRLSGLKSLIEQEGDIVGKLKARRLGKEVAKAISARDRYPTSYGLDIMIDTEGKARIIEMNPGGGSGFPLEGYAPFNLYKKLTGRHTKLVSGAGAGATGLATHIVQKRLNNNER